MACGHSSGVTNGNQMSLEQQEAERKAAENEATVGVSPKNIEYDDNKMENYLLNLEHPQGGGKAKFLRDVLGYVKGDGHLLHKNIIRALNGLTPVNTTKTMFGTKYEYDAMLASKNGNLIPARVVVVLQNDTKKSTYRIVTLYPRKKAKTNE